MSTSDDRAARAKRLRRQQQAKRTSGSSDQAAPRGSLPDDATDPIYQEKLLESRLQRVNEELARSPRALLEHERVRVARNLWDLLEELEQRSPPIKKTRVLQEAGKSAPGSLDSTKHLPRYALRPEHENVEQRRRRLTQSLKPYCDIAAAAAKLAGERRQDAYLLRLFDDTKWTARGTETDDLPPLDVLDRMYHLLNQAGQAVIKTTGFADALRQVERAPQLLEPREKDPSPRPATEREAALLAVREAAAATFLPYALPLPRTPRIFLGEFATSAVQKVVGRFAWCRSDWHPDLEAKLPTHIRALTRRLNAWMKAAPPIVCCTQKVCQVWLSTGPYGPDGAAGMGLIFGERLRLWTESQSIPTQVEAALAQVQPPASYSFSILWHIVPNFEFRDSYDAFWGGRACTHITNQSRLRMTLNALWMGDGDWDGSNSDDARFDSPNALPSTIGDPDVVSLFEADFVDENGNAIDLSQDWFDVWEVQPLSAKTLGKLAHSLPDYHLPLFEIYGDNRHAGADDCRLAAAETYGPAVATSISAMDARRIAAVCDAASNIPIVEVARNTMLAQLQRACLNEELREHSLQAVIERVVREWTEQVRARALEDETVWRRHFDAALAALKQKGQSSGG